jgi:GNAT superfamily N-acetyltransferase
MNSPLPLPIVAMRRAIETDLPEVTALLAGFEPDGAQLPPERARDIFARIQATPRMAVWLATSNERTVGTYTMLVMENLGHHGMPLAIVESVMVAPTARGGRIGEVMMRHAVARAAEAGCYKLALSSNSRRLDAHRFYRRLGFAPHGISFSITP